MSNLTHRGYGAGHPWYYLLGGDIPTPKDIRAHVLVGNYAGYLEQLISEADGKPEPKRSKVLADLRGKIVAELDADLSRYRSCARDLRSWREMIGWADPLQCDDAHTAISLKFNHIVNGFANLRTLDNLPSQGDLFGLL
ncbi:MAG: hypothetical protein ACRBBQ_02050 [Cognatishimia sp.]